MVNMGSFELYSIKVTNLKDRRRLTGLWMSDGDTLPSGVQIVSSKEEEQFQEDGYLLLRGPPRPPIALDPVHSFVGDLKSKWSGFVWERAFDRISITTIFDLETLEHVTIFSEWIREPAIGRFKISLLDVGGNESRITKVKGEIFVMNKITDDLRTYSNTKWGSELTPSEEMTKRHLLKTKKFQTLEAKTGGSLELLRSVFAFDLGQTFVINCNLECIVEDADGKECTRTIGMEIMTFVPEDEDIWESLTSSGCCQEEHNTSDGNTQLRVKIFWATEFIEDRVALDSPFLPEPEPEPCKATNEEEDAEHEAEVPQNLTIDQHGDDLMQEAKLPEISKIEQDGDDLIHEAEVPENSKIEQQGGGVVEEKWHEWYGENVFRVRVPTHKVGGIVGSKEEFTKRICDEGLKFLMVQTLKKEL